MLYLGTALKSTAVTHALSIPGLLAPPGPSAAQDTDADAPALPPALVVAKGNVLEVHEPRETGLVKVAETEVWGMIVGLEWVEGREGLGPAIVVMTDHPLARLLCYTITTSASPAPTPAYALRLTATHQLTRLSARPAEHFTALVADRAAGVVVASLYTGLLVVVEVGAGLGTAPEGLEGQAPGPGSTERRHSEAAGQAHSKGKRKSSLMVSPAVGSAIAEEGEGEADGDIVPVFTEAYEINIREHNLLSLAFLRARPSRRRSSAAAAPNANPRRLSMSTTSGPTTRSRDPTLLFLFLTPKFTTHLLPRRLSRAKKALEDLAPPVDLLADARFLVPAAKRLVGLPGGVAVIGDEWTAEYEMGWTAGRASASGTGSTPRKASMSSVSGAHDSALSRSPEALRATPENKRRKGSVGGSLVPTVGAGDSREPTFTIREGWRVRQGFGDVTSATAISGQDGVPVILMCDDMGRMSMISHDASRGKRESASATLLGIVPAATAICHLDGPYVFLASQTGDSQLVSLAGAGSAAEGPAEDRMDVDGPSGAASTDALTVLDAWTNIGPVHDFVLVQDEGGASAQVVTASGESSSGSLRTVRSGLGLEDVLAVEGVPAVDGLFTLVSERLGQTIIIASTPNTSQAFSVAATPEGSISFQPISIADWASASPAEAIVMASCRDNCIVLACGGGNVRSFAVAPDGSLSTERQITVTVNDERCEVSALDCGNAAAASSGLETQQTRLAAYGTWGTNRVGLINLESGKPAAEAVQEVAHISSIRLRNGREVLVGLGNGCLVSYDLVSQQGLDVPLKLSNRKQLTLGVEPVLLSTSSSELEVEGSYQIASLSDKVSVIHRERGRVMASSTSGKDTTAVNTLYNEALGSCLVIATNDCILMQRVTSLKELQMRKIELGYDTPTGIAYHSELKVYGVAINRATMDPETGNEEKRAMFRLFDAGSFQPLAELELPVGHEIISLNLLHLQGKTIFSLGTVKPVQPGTVGQAPSGYITLVEALAENGERDFRLDTLVSEETGGPVYDSKAVWDCLVIAVDNRAELYSFDANQNEIKLLSSWGNAFYVSCLSVQDLPDGKQRLHVGDGMRSVFAFERASNGDLLDVGRDIKPHWVVTMEEIESEGGGVIVSDTSFNILTVRHKDNKMENAAGIAVHDTASRFRKGAMTASYANTSAVRPEVLFATRSGALCVVADVGETESKILSDLQRNMDEVIAGPGVTWRGYREVHTEGSGKPRGTLGFIDGDYVKRFLDVPASGAPVTALRILNGTNEFERVGLGVGKSGGAADLDQVSGVLDLVTALH